MLKRKKISMVVAGCLMSAGAVTAIAAETRVPDAYLLLPTQQYVIVEGVSQAPDSAIGSQSHAPEITVVEQSVAVPVYIVAVDQSTSESNLLMRESTQLPIQAAFRHMPSSASEVAGPAFHSGEPAGVMAQSSRWPHASGASELAGPTAFEISEAYRHSGEGYVTVYVIEPGVSMR